MENKEEKRLKLNAIQFDTIMPVLQRIQFLKERLQEAENEQKGYLKLIFDANKLVNCNILSFDNNTKEIIYKEN